MDLMISLEFVRVYMDDLVIITREILEELLHKMETVLTRLHDSRLKVNAAKSLFCAHEIEYLIYLLTRDGIKPQPKKVQVILTLNPPNNLAGKVANMLALCCPNSQMSAHLANMPLLWQHKIDPDTPFLCR
jgi:hypothetical protein